MIGCIFCGKVILCSTVFLIFWQEFKDTLKVFGNVDETLSPVLDISSQSEQLMFSCL